MRGMSGARLEIRSLVEANAVCGLRPADGVSIGHTR